MSVQKIGDHIRHEEDPRLLRGRGRYADDVRLPPEARGYVLRSPHAHARIQAINTAAAKKSPGVLCILTGDDLKARGLGTLRPLVRRDGSPAFAVPSRSSPTAWCAMSATRSRSSSPKPERGQGRGRADRGRLRDPAGGDRGRGGARDRVHRRCGRTTPATRRRSMPRLPARCISSSTARSTIASPPTAWGRAAASRSTTPTTTNTRSGARSSRCTAPGPSPTRSSLTGQRLKRGVFTSVVELQAAINRSLADANGAPKPFVWTKSADAILAAVTRGRQALEAIHYEQSPASRVMRLRLN